MPVNVGVILHELRLTPDGKSALKPSFRRQ